MRIKKKHQAGAAKNFITRTQAVKKLQVSLADFRRLCIFKGIYPRQPRNKKKANKGSTAPTTFYYTKDIQYLLHEPVLQKFREHKIFARKLSRALGRGEVGDAKRLDDNRPRYKLDHIIKERYPTFMDAVRDINDGLSMLFLFSALPASDSISNTVIEAADRICNQWLAYVARERLLRKVFVSIKGIYYEADIKGHNVLWLVPFKFPQNVPSEIDFRIMLTFLEFYNTLLQFVLYRLYNEANLVYPPKIDEAKLKGIGGVTAYLLETSKSGLESILPTAQSATSDNSKDTLENIKTLQMDEIVKKDDEQKDENEEEDEESSETANEAQTTEGLDSFTTIESTVPGLVSDTLAQPKASQASQTGLFEGFTFFVGREVPLDALEFLILAFGGNFISESAQDDLLENADDDKDSSSGPDLSTVTHQICDRPTISNKVPGRTYIQPQWVFDSINKGKLVPVSLYGPGEALPPHLSPWVASSGYNPEAPLSDQSEEEEDEEEEVDGEQLEDEEDEEDEDAIEHQLELEKESSGVSFTESEKIKPINGEENKKKKRPKINEEKEEKELKMIMMTNKNRKLYKKMQYGIDKNQAREDALKNKRRKIEQTKAKIQGK